MSRFKRVYVTCGNGNLKELRVLVKILMDSGFIRRSFSTFQEEIFVGEINAIPIALPSAVVWHMRSFQISAEQV